MLIESKINFQRNGQKKTEVFYKLARADRLFSLFQKVSRSTSMNCLSHGLKYAIRKHVSFLDSNEAYSALISLAATYLLQMNSSVSNLTLQSKNIYNSQMLCKHCRKYRKVFVCERPGREALDVVEFPFWFNTKDFFHLVCYLKMKRESKLKEIRNFTVTKRALLTMKYAKQLAIQGDH